MGGLGNGGWRGVLWIAQCQAPLRGEGSGELGWGLPGEAGVGSFSGIVRAPGGECDAGMMHRVSFNSSSRKRPLKLSMKAFWVGLPGAM